ncbi:zinc finger protein 638 [Fundulus heteroclitus]|uniref:zinc finger protein 638 n=1 Tax=Fundulus heteroclitus TaxID=8078 RepID=UPI00165AC6E5|nr:zinc finger protein 638 [Fundulus heteroclitus]
MQQQLQLGQQPTLPQGFPATQLTPSLLIPNCPTPAMRGPNQRDARTGVGVSKQEPTPAMMQDYTAATPRIFPHTCCLCRKECSNLKDWVSHQNTALHLENCQLLRTRYPGWDGWTLDFLSSPGEGTQPAPSTLGKNVQNRHQKSSRETASRSLSPHRQRGSEDRKRGSEDRKERQDRREKRFSPYRSRSPHSYDASESRRERERSRSWSPETSRHSFRSRSRSYDRTTSSYRRSRSGSYEKRRQRREREAAAKRSQESKKMAQKRSSPRRSRERRWSPDRSEPRRRRSRSADRLAKRLLEKAAPPVMSRTKQAELEAVVKSLAPVLLAELANLKSSTAASSSSSSKTEKKSSFSKSTNATLSRQKGGTSSSAKATVSRATSSFHVSVSGVNRSLTYDDIFKAMGTFGKVKSVILYRSTKQARVEFEKEEDAKKLQSLEICQVNGWPVVVDGPMGTASKNPVSTKEQKAAPQKTSAKSDITKGKKQPEPKNTTAGKLVTKAKVLVSKAKGVTVNQATKTVKKATATGNSAGKSVAVKSSASGKKPQADQAKKPVTKTKPAGDNAKSAEAPKQASKITKQSKTTSSTTKPQPTIKADQVSVKASSEVQPSTESKSESSAEAQETINHAVEQQNQSTNKTEAQEDSVQMETETSSVNVKNEPSPRETGTSADKENSPAGSTASSARCPGTTAADLVQMDENVFKELTAAIQMHRLAKGVSSESKGEESTTDSRTTCKDGKQENTQPSKDKKEGKVSLERFDELDFSSGDFVTVDEVNEDMDVPGVEGHPSSSKLTPRDKKGMQSSAARKSSTGSASSSPKSAKGSQSLRSTPVSANKKKSLSEPKKSEAKGHKTCSTGQKAQSNKSEPSSSGQGSHSSETSIKLSVKDQQEKKEIEQAKSDHKAPVESSAANSVEAELNSDSSAKMDVPTEGQSLQETDLKDETVEETKSKENEKKSDTDGKSTGEERGDENKQLLDSLSRKSDEQQNKDDAQDETTVTQTPEVEQDQILHQGGVQVVESTDNNKAQSDECDEMEVSGKLQDGTKDQAAAADDGDEGPSKMEKDNSSEKQDMSVKKDEARTKEIKKGGKSLGDCLVVVYDVLDATKDDLVPKTSAAEGSGRRRSARGNKKQTPAPVEEPKSGNEEETLTALDSVEDESRSDKPVVTRSTRGRRENATKKVEENTKKREDKTPTRRQRTPARDSKEKDGEKTPKADVLSDTVETDTSKETDGVQDDQPITQEPRRGRPKKDNKTSKKQTEPKGESVRQSVDSLKDECQERESETTDEMAADVNNVNTLDQTPQAAFGKASPKTNDETAAATIDDLMNQGELSPEELKKRQAAEKTENEQEEGRSMERETGEQRSQSGADGGGSGEMVRDEEQNREDVETVKEAASESEILNEIGAKAESEAATQEGMITEEGPQELVAEKEEDQKEEQGALEAQSQVQESQPESLSELDEGGQNQSKKTDEEDAMQASSSSKRKHNDNTDVDERKPEPSGPEAKRSRSQSPSVAGDLQLPPFNPQNPLGEEFVVPKSGFFCNLCSVFYLNESTAKKVHCGTRKHYDNLLKHYKKLQQETGGAAQSVQDSL